MATETQNIYVEEDAGDDAKADGSEKLPYKTLLHAHIQHPPETVQYMTRKSQTGPSARVETNPNVCSGKLL
jgi:asparaginyl-tRNA synthetase